MYISIIIPTYNKYQRLSMILLSLTFQTYSSEDFEVVIVDDGSLDNTKKEVEEFQKKYPNINLIYVYQKNMGRAIARNTGIQIASGELIIFLDDDRMVLPTFIEEHVRSHMESDNKRIAVLGKRMNLFISGFQEQYEDIKAEYIKNSENLYKKAREEYYWRKVKKVVNTSIEWILFATGNVSIKKDILIEVGCFNKEFVGWGLEDTELGYRLFKQSIKMVINEKALNYHIEHARNQSERQHDEQTNNELFYSIHPELPVELFQKYVHGEISLEEFERRVDGKNEAISKEDESYYGALADWF